MSLLISIPNAAAAAIAPTAIAAAGATMLAWPKNDAAAAAGVAVAAVVGVPPGESALSLTTAAVVAGTPV
jgi:hypothetical protein